MVKYEKALHPYTLRLLITKEGSWRYAFAMSTHPHAHRATPLVREPSELS